jgi:hypothetical protein
MYLNEKRHKGMVLKVKLHLVTEGLSGRMRKEIGPKHSGGNIEWTHDRMFLVELCPKPRILLVSTKICMNRKSDLHDFAFIKRHRVIREFPSAEHV